MKTAYEPRITGHGAIEPARAIEMLCANCGYDLDEAELAADVCADCKAPLNLRQHVSIQVTTVPAAAGGTLR